MIRSLKVLTVLLVVLLCYLLFWPVPVSPKAWESPGLASYDGDFTVNNKLTEFTKVSLDGLTGPEAIIQNPQTGEMFATSHEGWLLRWQPGSATPKKWLELGGRPLGIDFDGQGNLWVANAYLGLMKVTPEGVVSTELDNVDDVPLRYADDLAIAPNGNIYLSDASTKFSAEQFGGTLEASLLDLLEHGLYGRIIEYNPQTKVSRLVMRGLSFANGVAVDQAGQFILVVETGEYRVWKFWLQGPKAGTQEIIISDLPGFPDNIHRGDDGRFWVGLAAPRVAILDTLAGYPKMRQVLQRFPEFMHPKVEPYGAVLAINSQGDVLANLQDPKGYIYATTGAFETESYLYVASLTAPFFARYSKQELDLN